MILSSTEVRDFLEHHGVKGMRWGIRKERVVGESTPKAPNQPFSSKLKNDVQITPDGAITIKKGGQLQRVVRNSDGALFKSGVDIGNDVTYASFTERDNATYITALGKKKGLFTKQASDILTLTAKSDLKSPSPQESAALYFKALKNNPKAFDELNGRLRDKFSSYNKEALKKAMANPKARSSFDLYAFAFDSGNYLDSPSLANKSFFDEVKKSGYNMLLDPSDTTTGISDKPVIILGGSKNIEVTGRREVDAFVKKAANKTLNQYNYEIYNGKTFLEQLGYEV